MNTIEFLSAKNKDYKIKFVNILKNTSTLSSTQLIEVYDKLLLSKNVMVEFESTIDLNFLNDLIMELMELEIGIRDCSFHEER